MLSFLENSVYLPEIPISTPQPSQTKYNQNWIRTFREATPPFVLKKNCSSSPPPPPPYDHEVITDPLAKSHSGHHQLLSTLCICLTFFLCFPLLSTIARLLDTLTFVISLCILAPSLLTHLNQNLWMTWFSRRFRHTELSSFLPHQKLVPTRTCRVVYTQDA